MPNFKWKLLQVHHHDSPLKVFNILHSLRQNSSFSFRQKQHQSTRNQTKHSFKTETQRACKHLSTTCYCQTQWACQWHFVLFFIQDVPFMSLYAKLSCWCINGEHGCSVETAASQVLLWVMHELGHLKLDRSFLNRGKNSLAPEHIRNHIPSLC